MKKINIMASLLLGGLLMTACKADRDDNPAIDLSKPQEAITLNTPVFANGTYDLEFTEALTLTCTQPAYGFPATTTYVVQLSVDENMTNPNELTTTYSTNKMSVPGRELAIATTKQLMEKGRKQEEFPLQTPVYLRIRAYINDVEGSEAFSNIVCLKSVKTKFALPDVQVPDPFYVIGNFNDNNWENAVATVPAYGNPTTQWRIVYIDGDGIKLSPTTSEANWSDDMITPIYTSTTAGFTVTVDGKVIANTPGWYLMVVDGAIDNGKRELSLEFKFSEAEVWLIGTSIINADAGITADNCWDESSLRSIEMQPYTKFTTPTDMKGEFVSPVLASPVDGDGGTRAYVKVKNYDWWKSEFFVFDKKIIYRGTGGDQERVNGQPGQQVYLNFSNDTGELK